MGSRKTSCCDPVNQSPITRGMANLNLASRASASSPKSEKIVHGAEPVWCPVAPSMDGHQQSTVLTDLKADAGQDKICNLHRCAKIVASRIVPHGATYTSVLRRAILSGHIYENTWYHSTF